MSFERHEKTLDSFKPEQDNSQPTESNEIDNGYENQTITGIDKLLRNSALAATAFGVLTASEIIGQTNLSSSPETSPNTSNVDNMLQASRVKASLIDYYLQNILPEDDNDATRIIASNWSSYKKALTAYSTHQNQTRLLVEVDKFIYILPKNYRQKIEETDRLASQSVSRFTNIEQFLLNNLNDEQRSIFLRSLSIFKKTKTKFDNLPNELSKGQVTTEDITLTYLKARTLLIKIIDQLPTETHEALERIERAQEIIKNLPQAPTLLQESVHSWAEADTNNPNSNKIYQIVTLDKGSNKDQLCRMVNKNKDTIGPNNIIQMSGIVGVTNSDATTIFNFRNYRQINTSNKAFWESEWKKKASNINLRDHTKRKLKESFKNDSWVKLECGLRVQERLLPHLFALMDSLAVHGYYLDITSTDEGMEHSEAHASGLVFDARIYKAYKVEFPNSQKSNNYVLLDEIEIKHSPHIDDLIKDFEREHPGIKWLNEYLHPSDNSTWPHYHFDFRRIPSTPFPKSPKQTQKSD